MSTQRPWYLSQLEIEIDPRLCHVCAELDFKWLINNAMTENRFRTYIPGRALQDDFLPCPEYSISDKRVTANIPELSLGFLTDIFQRRGSCNFCHLVTITIAFGYETDVEKLLEFDFETRPVEDVYVTLWNSKKHEVEAADYPKATRELLIMLRDVRQIEINFSAFSTFRIHRLSEVRVPYEGIRVRDQMDLRAAQTWISQFSPPQNISGERVDGFRLIDVQNECVIPVSGPQGCRYLALSYVWGGDQKFKNLKARDEVLRQPGSLSGSDKLPKTIADAMYFAKAVGERFLWVDSLCIVQDDENKMVQIQAMDRIYGCAVVTIVAAYGTNAHAGLPGVRAESGERWKQHVVSVRGMQFANRQIVLSDLGGSKTWYQRAWTYQEEVLSLRTIRFGRDGAFFECEDGLTAEDIVPPQRDRQVQPTIRALGVPGLRNIQLKETLPNRELYGLLVMFYSTKQISFQNDALNAFTGIVNMMQPSFRRPFLYGLPSSEPEYAVLWHPQRQLDRRLDDATSEPVFPTWSWVGWKGNVLYLPHGWVKFSRVTWTDADDEVEFTTEEWRGVDMGTVESELSTWQHRPQYKGKSYVEEGQPERPFAHPVSEIIPEHLSSRRFLKPDSHVLKFHAFTASLKAHEEPQPASMLSYIDSGVTYLGLYDKYGHSCGGLYLQETRRSSEHKQPDQCLELVAISRTFSDSELGNHNYPPPPPDDQDIRANIDRYAEKQRIKSDTSASSYFALQDFEEPK